jgi:hypothetical protein
VIDEIRQHRDKIYCVTIFRSESTCSVINELAAAHRNVKFVVRDATWDPQPYSHKLPVTGIHKGSAGSLFDVYGENYSELDAAVEKWKNLSFTYPENISFGAEKLVPTTPFKLMPELLHRSLTTCTALRTPCIIQDPPESGPWSLPQCSLAMKPRNSLSAILMKLQASIIRTFCFG